MNIIVVDDEKIALKRLIDSIEEVEKNAYIVGFQSSKDALDFLDNNPCDIAFLDIEMRETNGIYLAKHIKIIKPDINIIFTTGYSEYGVDAFEVHASGYVLKPITAEKIAKEMRELRYPIMSGSRKRIRFQTFGNFEVFLDDRPIQFKHKKTKELLAFLVDRKGALCTNKEIISVLWEDRNNESYFKKLRADLIKVLSDAGCEDILVRQWGKLGILCNEVECDYYNWNNGQVNEINAFRGEYMSQYSWGEETVGQLRGL